jgi:8-oxo-dGTP pyrophosphatase MutT (NUDIX family)
MEQTTATKCKVQVWVYYRHPHTGAYFFLILRTRQDRGDFWQPVTGSVEAGETLEHGAKREAEEETGLSFVQPPKRVGEPFEFESRWGGRVTEYGFSLEISPALQGSEPRVALDLREHVDFRWCTRDDVLPMLHFPSNKLVFTALVGQLAG